MKVITEREQKHYRQSGILLILCVTAAMLTACAVKAPSTKPSAGTVENYTCLDNSFTVSVPKDWEKEEQGHPYGDLTKISGVRLNSSITPDGVPVTLSVLHYSGEHLFKTPDEFIRDKMNSIVRIDYGQEATTTEIRIAGRTGRTFQIKTFKLVFLPRLQEPPMQEGVVYERVPPYKLIDITERYIVIPASEGYFVLGYRSPVTMTKKYQGMFEKVVRSFHPLLP